MNIVIKGLMPQQANAVVKAFQEGHINELVNRLYMNDIFEGSQVFILPVVSRLDAESDSVIDYLPEN